MRTTYYILTVLFSFALLSCEKDNPDENEDTGYASGIFISNEGSYGSSNGSISYLNRDSMVLHNDLFNLVNNRPLGDVVQSISIHEERAYIVVNNSQKVEVVDIETFSSVGIIEGLSYPRYFLGINDNKGYVSNGSHEGFIYVVNLENLSITDSIQVGMGPEEMILKNNRVYVANSGGWSTDNTVSVIDISGDELIETIQVGDNPKGFALDKNEDLWVLCKGKVVYGPDYSVIEETKSELVKVDINTFEVSARIDIGQLGDFYSPSGISSDIGGDNIIFTEAGGLYQMDITASVQPSSPLVTGSFYGFGVDPLTATIYALISGDFTSPGYLHRYYPGGEPLDTMSLGIAPSWVEFN